MVVMGLGMVSCVSNTESDSVKAIRDAKAAQLLALAELHKAQAEAETLLAKAQAALLEAEARYQNALAEGQEIENQIAKETLEAEVNLIKAQLEKQLLDLLEQIQNKKSDLTKGYYTQIEYWFGQLTQASSQIITLKATLSTIMSDVVSEKVLVEETVKQYKAQIAMIDILIAEYTKYIAENDIDYTKLYNEIIPLMGQLEEMEAELELKEDNYDDAVDALYDEVGDVNEDIFDMYYFLDQDSDDYLDYNERIFKYSTNSFLSVKVAPEVTLNDPVMVLFEENNANQAGWLEDYIQRLGTESDKFDTKKTYAQNTYYARYNYRVECLETFNKDFAEQVMKAQKDVEAALKAKSDAKTAEEKAAAEKVLSSAIEALNAYTKNGATPNESGSFANFVSQLYTAGGTGFFSPLMYISKYSTTIDSKTVNYWKVNEVQFTEELPMDLKLWREQAKEDVDTQKGNIVYYSSRVQDGANIVEAIYSLEKYFTEQSEQLAKDLKAIQDLQAQVSAFEAQIEAKMKVLETQYDVDKAQVADDLKGYIVELQAERDNMNAWIQKLENTSGKQALYDATLKQIGYYEQKIEIINATIDKLQAELEAFLSSTES